MFDDSLESCEPLKVLIGKRVIDVCLRRNPSDPCEDNKGNVTLIFDDGTELQGTDGEYGTNNMEILRRIK